MGTRIGTKIGQGAPGTAFIEYDLSANFNSAANQTFTNAQVLNTAEEGVDYGSLTVVDSGAGTVKVVSNELELVGTGNINETGVFGSTATTKALGKALFLTYTPSNVSERDYFGFVNTAGLDIGNNPESIFYHRDSGEVRVVNPATAATLGVATLAASTEYKIAWLLGGTDSGGVAFKTGDTVGDFLYGSRILLKGGTYTNWTLLWLMSTGNTSSLYAQAQLRNATAVTLDNILIPTNVLDVDTMFQPNFLDTFAGDNDDQLVSAHTPEVVGGATGTGNPWESGSTTWTIQSNKANNNPGLGSELITTQVDRDFSGASNWTNNDIDAYDETDNLTITADAEDQYCTLPKANFATVAGKIYKISFDVANLVSNWKIEDEAAAFVIANGVTDATTNTFYFTCRTTNGGIRITSTAADSSGDFDNFTCKEVTLNEMFASDDLSKNQGLFDVGVTIPSDNDGFAGLVLCLDSESSPANFIRVHYDQEQNKVDAWKNVAGTYTNLFFTAATYSAGATLRAIVDYVSATDDVKVKVYYNGALIDSEQTIEDNGIAGNTRFGILSVDSSNSLENFTVHNRTDGDWDTEISTKTMDVY